MRTMICDISFIRDSLPVFCAHAYYGTHAHYEVLRTPSVTVPRTRLLLELGERVHAGLEGKNCGTLSRWCSCSVSTATVLCMGGLRGGWGGWAASLLARTRLLLELGEQVHAGSDACPRAAMVLCMGGPSGRVGCSGGFSFGSVTRVLATSLARWAPRSLLGPIPPLLPGCHERDRPEGALAALLGRSTGCSHKHEGSENPGLSQTNAARGRSSSSTGHTTCGAEGAEDPGLSQTQAASGRCSSSTGHTTCGDRGLQGPRTGPCITATLGLLVHSPIPASA
ncbi:hypothetical protein NDU88_005577 [Pleurodeles waltl]|uniref:Uncharacterized protein n=1 Tax=Pleurodeles waltl TaxID=8319 RepID=A0AAV7QIQ6_PLEWA|nr:hypothetical protein NDU88_005577 [Pleurodeles waltl]